ncbi:MAG: hypothetical protein J4F98_11850 [Acidobacteria bacterium]|nr:hypothetical protein [Acidobacteriota bacterium]
MTPTPIERLSADAFQVCEWTCASMVQNRPSASGDTLDPSPGTSRSRNVRAKDSIQRVRAASDSAR